MLGCRISLTNRNLENGDIFFGDGSLNGFIPKWRRDYIRNT